MSGYVGGDPSLMHDGGVGLRTLAGTLSKSRSTGARSAAHRAKSAAGDATAARGIDRFGAALSTTLSDTGTQLRAGGTLATNASSDLRNVGG